MILALNGNSLTERQLSCPSGKKVLSGGAQLITALPGSDRTKINVLETYADTDSSWKFVVSNASTTTVDYRFSIICATAP